MSRRIWIAAYWFERTSPAVLGAVVFALGVAYGSNMEQLFRSHKIEWANTYSSMAGVFAVITGFLASFYGSVQAIADTRLKRIARAKIFVQFLRDIKEATIAGFALAVISLPFIVITPVDLSNVMTRTIVAAWVGASFYALATFVRVGRLLFYVFEIQPTEDEGAV